MKTVEQLERENAELRQHIERLEAKIGRLSMALAEFDLRLNGPGGRAKGGMTGSVKNPGDPGWVKGRAH